MHIKRIDSHQYLPTYKKFTFSKGMSSMQTNISISFTIVNCNEMK